MPASATSPLVVALALLLASCGGDGGGGIRQADLRECLLQRGAKVESGSAASSLVPGTVASPDFQARIGTDTLDAIVEGSADKAGRTAADLRSALRSYGVPDPERRLVQRGNVIVLFGRDPSSAADAAVNACTG